MERAKSGMERKVQNLRKRLEVILREGELPEYISSDYVLQRFLVGEEWDEEYVDDHQHQKRRI